MALQLDGNTGITYNTLNQDIKSLLLPKNWIINGMFDIWQRGTTQSTELYGSADRWYLALSGATGSLSRQTFTIGQTEVPNNPKYFARFQTTVANDNSRVEQRIEDVTKFANKQVAYSFWIKADASRTITVVGAQVFGDGGSASVSLTNTHFVGTTWQKITGVFTLANINGKTIGNNNYFGFMLQNSAFETFTFDIANVSLVDGSVAVECQNQPYADVLRECQRYLYPIVTLEGSTYYKVGVGFAMDTSNIIIIVNLPVPMRVNPTLIVNDATKFWATDGVSNLALTSLTRESVSNSAIKLTATKTTSLIQFRPYLVERAGNNLGYIWADAEL